MARCEPWRIGEGARMFHCNRTTRMLRARAALVLCAALVTDVAIAAPPTLQTVAVTPAASLDLRRPDATLHGDRDVQRWVHACSGAGHWQHRAGVQRHLCIADQRWREVLGR